MSGDTEVITCNVTLLAFKLDKKNAKIIIQPSETLPVKLTGTHY